MYKSTGTCPSSLLPDRHEDSLQMAPHSRSNSARIGAATGTLERVCAIDHNAVNVLYEEDMEKGDNKGE